LRHGSTQFRQGVTGIPGWHATVIPGSAWKSCGAYSTPRPVGAIEFGRPVDADDAVTHNRLDVFTTPVSDRLAEL
jgi:hypothetical protein